MYNYFSFDGALINDIAIVTKIEKPYVPEPSISTIDVASRDGKIFDGVKFNPIKIPVSLAIIGDTEDDYRRRVQGLCDLFSTKQEVPIGFCDNINVYGMLNGEFTVTKKNGMTGYADIELICQVPYSYSNNVITFNDEDTQRVTVENNGQINTLPYMSIGLSKDAHFIQVQNNDTGEKILVGNYPRLTLSASAKKEKLILHDFCRSVSNLVLSSANIDADRSTNGTFTISSNGEAYTLSNMGDGTTKFKGACGRIPLSKNLDEFKLMCRIQCNSTGKNGDPNYFVSDSEKVKETIKEGSKTPYYVVNSSGVNYRTGPGTNYKSKGIIPKGTKLTDVTMQNGWAKVKYKTKTYYIHSKYLTRKVKDNSKSVVKEFTVSNMWVMPENKSIGGSQFCYSKPKLSSKVSCTIPYGTCLRIIQRPYNYEYTENGSDKTMTFYRLYKPYVDSHGKKHKGYINKERLVGAASMEPVVDYEDDPAYADDKTGTIELYGFDTNGTQIFRICVGDYNEYFEYNQCQVSITNNNVLTTSNDDPKPTSDQVSEGNKTVTKYYLSGKHGDWNDLNGYFTIIRKKVNKKYVWDVTLQKNVKGKFTKSISVKNKKSSKFSTEPLSYLALYIGTSADTMNKCTSMGLSDVKVYELNPEATEEKNILYFEQGDVVDLDFENGDCYINGEKRNDLVDIGSTYFPIEPGEANLQLVSDDKEASLAVQIKERWIGVVDEDRSTPPDSLDLTSE